MKDQLPFQARWTVRVLKWLLSREVSLEEMLQDEDVLSGIVAYLTKKVQVEEEIPGQKEHSEKLESLEKELDFVRCRLQGADQQRKNEVQELEKRNAELREEVVKLTHKLKASEKEVFEAKFASGNVKASMKKLEEELRDMRKKVEAQEQELARRSDELAQAAARQKELESEMERLRALLDEAKRELETRQNLSSQWTDERARLMFMLEERDNALSEAREGQAAATREIENLSSQLDALSERLGLLETEAVQKGVPVVKVGMEPVVGEKAARMVASRQRKMSEDTPIPKVSKRKVAGSDSDPISAIVGVPQKNIFEFSDDARYAENVNLDVESIPEPIVQNEKNQKKSAKNSKNNDRENPVKNRQNSKRKNSGTKKTAKEKKDETGTEKDAKPANTAVEPMDLPDEKKSPEKEKNGTRRRRPRRQHSRSNA